MKITEIRIENFGIRRNLNLALDGSVLNVIHGPNEAGKTTLLKFICGLLYGFENSDGMADEDGSRTNIQSGSLLVEHEQQIFEIGRTTNHAGCEMLSVMGGDENLSDRERLSYLLSETKAKIFNHVFAVGLQEVQLLSTLHDEDVARHIYGLSLGPDGQQLLRLLSDLDSEKCRFFDAAHRTGELVELLQQDEILSNEIETLKDLRDQHEQLCCEWESVEAEIGDMKARKAGIESQLRGHQFLEKVIPPWKQVQEIQNELETLPDLRGFPENGLQRLEELENEMDSAVPTRDSINAEADLRKNEAAAIKLDSEFRKYVEVIECQVEQRDWAIEFSMNLKTSKTRAGELQTQLDEAFRKLGDDWSLNRLESIDVSPADHYRLLCNAQRYQSAQSRQKRLRNRYQQMAKSCQKQLARLNDRRKLLDEATIDDALSATGQRLADLYQLAQLIPCETQLEQQRIALVEETERARHQMNLPQWVVGMWGILGFTGGLFAILGFVTGLVANATSGIVLSLSGLTGLGTAWGLNSQHRRQTRERRENLHRTLEDVEARLCEVRNEIAQLTQQVSHSHLCETMDSSTGEESTGKRCPSDPEWINQTVQHLVELERWRELDIQIGRRRRRLCEFHRVLQTIQRQVGEAREEWCRELNRIGLPETVDIAEVFETWQRIVVAHKHHKDWRIATAEVQAQQRIYGSFQEKMLELDTRIRSHIENFQSEADEEEDLFDVLNRWERQLAGFRQKQSEQNRLLEEEHSLREQAAEYETQINSLLEQHSSLLQRGGAGNREEFEHRSELAEEYRELAALLEIARSELEAVAQTEPDLAVTEEDLLEFNAEENSRSVRVLQSEREDLETDIEEAFEKLGRIKEQAQDLEQDRRSCRLRFNGKQLEARLKRKLEEWIAVLRAGKILEQMRSRFERTKQPEALVAASRFLRRMTLGRYNNIWTPLGERQLMVDDEQGHSLSVEQLSGGTREQLFLSVRFALVEEFRRRGIELPMVLDDVIVNFDQSRAEAAAEALHELVEQGQQVLFFTCHQHLARLFEKKGANLIRLPENRAEREERRAG